MLWGCFSAAGTGRLVRAGKNLNAPKYRESLNENSVQSIQTGRRFTFQQDNESKHTARLACTQLCEWPGQSLRLNTIKYFWRNLKMCVCPHPTWQRREEEGQIIAKCWRSKLVASNPKRIEAAIGAKGASTKYWTKAVNTYIHAHFLFIYKFAKISNKFLSHCHGVFFVEFWGK